MFLVRSAAEIMEKNAAVLDAGVLFSEFMKPAASGLRHVVVTKEGRPFGVIRVNADLRRAIGTVAQSVTLGELCQRDFIIVRESEAMYEVISGMSKEQAVAAVVMANETGKGPAVVRGIITKDYIADAVAGSIDIYAG